MLFSRALPCPVHACTATPLGTLQAVQAHSKQQHALPSAQACGAMRSTSSQPMLTKPAYRSRDHNGTIDTRAVARRGNLPAQVAPAHLGAAVALRVKAGEGDAAAGRRAHGLCPAFRFQVPKVVLKRGVGAAVLLAAALPARAAVGGRTPLCAAPQRQGWGRRCHQVDVNVRFCLRGPQALARHADLPRPASSVGHRKARSGTAHTGTYTRRSNIVPERGQVLCVGQTSSRRLGTCFQQRTACSAALPFPQGSDRAVELQSTDAYNQCMAASISRYAQPHGACRLCCTQAHSLRGRGRTREARSRHVLQTYALQTQCPQATAGPARLSRHRSYSALWARLHTQPRLSLPVSNLGHFGFLALPSAAPACCLYLRTSSCPPPLASMEVDGAEAAPAQSPRASDASSDSGSDFEEVEASAEDMERITDLEAELSVNANLYDKHVEVCVQSDGVGMLRWIAIAGCCPRLLLVVTPVPRVAVHRHAAALQDARAPPLGAARDARALPLQRGAVARVAGRRAAGRPGAGRARPG